MAHRQARGQPRAAGAGVGLTPLRARILPPPRRDGTAPQMAKKSAILGLPTSSSTASPGPTVVSPRRDRSPLPAPRFSRRSSFRKFIRDRAKTRPKKRRWAHYDDGSGDDTQCPRCDRGQHRRCSRLKHCTAKKRSPAGINKREQGARSRRAGSPLLRSVLADVCHVAPLSRRSCRQESDQGGRQAGQAGLSRRHRVLVASSAFRRRLGPRLRRRRPRRRLRRRRAADRVSEIEGSVRGQTSVSSVG